MGIYNPKRTRGVQICIRTCEKQQEQFNDIISYTGKTKGITFDNMMEVLTLMIEDDNVTIAELRGVLKDGRQE